MHPHQNILVVVAEPPSEHVDAAGAVGPLVDPDAQTDRGVLGQAELVTAGLLLSAIGPLDRHVGAKYP